MTLTLAHARAAAEANLAAIMKGGRFHQRPAATQH